MLDALAPITAILEVTNEMTVQYIKYALITVSMLIGNANTKLTHLQREKLIPVINYDSSGTMTIQYIMEALIAVSMLIGNANAKLTHLRREKLIPVINHDSSGTMTMQYIRH